MKRLSENGVLEKIKKHRGNISAIARGYEVSRTAVQKFIRSRPALAEALSDVRESFVDEAESKFVEAVESGQPWALRLILTTLGKERGWVERHETKTVTGSPEAELTDEQLEREIEIRQKRIKQAAERKGT